MKRTGAPHRGQTLLLFALSLLLLTLMVCMTLSFGTKAKEKMELQTVADQAAYSTAVATARTFNVISVTNRAMIAHMVALLGVQSSISFSTSYLAYLYQLWLNYSLEIGNQLSWCNLPHAYCGCIPAAVVLFSRWIPVWREISRVRGVLSGLDAAAHGQAANNRAACTGLYLGELEAYLDQLYYQSLDRQRLAGKIARQASGGLPEWVAPAGADTVAKRETGLIPLVDGAVNINNVFGAERHAVLAAMSSRGHPWTANRDTTAFLPSGAPQLIQRAFQRIGIGREVTLDIEGNAYFGPKVHDNTTLSTAGDFAWADDHGLGASRYRGLACKRPLTPPISGASYVTSRGQHRAGFAAVIPREFPDMPSTPLPVFGLGWSDSIHTLDGPPVWSSFVDYNYVRVAFPSDNWAQPKLPVVVQRDLTRRAGPADPWNLGFRFRFSPTGADFDLGRNKRIVLRDGTDISRQTAMATGIAYYHRQGHWKEPPNLLNPFWRAGLTHADIDDQARGSGGDIPKTLNGAGVGWAADAYSQLYNSGYRGMQ